MKTSLFRTFVVSASLAAAASPSAAIPPALLLMAKQMVTDAVTTQVKGMLLGSLRDQGCKGAALANAIDAVPGVGGGGPLGALGMAGGASGLAGGAMGMASAAAPGTPVIVPASPGALAGLPMPSGQSAATPAAMAGAMGRLMPDPTSMMASMDPSQQAAMEQALKAMSQPLSPRETVATLDELASLGILPASMQGEMKDCLTLMPQAAAAMGASMSVMRMMIPQMREAREQLHALTPAEQDEMAAALAAEFDDQPAEDRAQFIEQASGGFFPPRVVESLKARMAAR